MDDKELKLELTDDVDIDDLSSPTPEFPFTDADDGTRSTAHGEAVDPTSLDGVSASLTDAIDLDEDSVKGNAVASAQDLVEEFKELSLAQKLSAQVNSLDALFPAQDKSEEYIKATASRLYDEIHKQAKMYVRDWCKINGYDQKWSNPYLKFFNKKTFNTLSEFIPQAYNITITHRDTHESVVLAELQPTPREASITAAKRLNFDNSDRRALAFSKFPKHVVEVILKNEKYLREARELYRLEEHRRQIDARKFVPSYVRERWLREINDKITHAGGLV